VIIIVMIASAINDRMQRKLDYLEEGRRILREQLGAVTGGKRLDAVGKVHQGPPGRHRWHGLPHRRGRDVVRRGLLPSLVPKSGSCGPKP
jgi:hypothetical protein